MEALTLKILTNAILTNAEAFIKTLETLELSSYFINNVMNDDCESVVRKLISNKETIYGKNKEFIRFEKVYSGNGAIVYEVTITAVRTEAGLFTTWCAETKLLYITEVA